MVSLGLMKHVIGNFIDTNKQKCRTVISSLNFLYPFSVKHLGIVRTYLHAIFIPV